MASEASRKKAEELLAASFVEHTEECQHGMWDEPGCTCGREELRDEIASALDEARADGEERGAERERRECYEAATLAFAQFRGGSPAGVEQRVSEAIAARGPMRGPEEE